jgi:hypothetical protein
LADLLLEDVAGVVRGRYGRARLANVHDDDRRDPLGELRASAAQ